MKRIGLFILSGGMLLVPIVLVILPPDFFDNGQSICLSVLFFDQTCYGCGMTRAIQHLLHLDFKAAYSFNKLSFIVFSVLIIVWLKELRKIVEKIITH